MRRKKLLPMPRPFLKWAGGKSELVDAILAYLPSQIETYFEPFFGGGAVFFALSRQGRFKQAVISDINRELIDTLIEIRDDASGVVEALKDITKHDIGEERYELIKSGACHNGSVAARMIFLNHTCFNGLYRVNRRGGFNVNWNGKTRYQPDFENIIAVSVALQGVTILHADYRIAKMARPGDAAFCDPPYIPVSKTSDFTAYSKDGFNLTDQLNLAMLCRQLHHEGVCVLATNSDTEETRSLYRHAFIEASLVELKASRRINSKGSKRGKVGELLFVSRLPTAEAAE